MSFDCLDWLPVTYHRHHIWYDFIKLRSESLMIMTTYPAFETTMDTSDAQPGILHGVSAVNFTPQLFAQTVLKFPGTGRTLP
jgi:hypothetical protein